MQEGNFQALLEALQDTSVFVIEQQSQQILYANQRGIAANPQLTLDILYHELGQGCSEQCPRLARGDKLKPPKPFAV